jgi:apolipoprotein D and lipocalin family protein
MFMKIILSVLFYLPIICLAQMANHSEPTVVPFVDLNRYAGQWYEIAKIPNPFQKKCVMNTTAEYTLLNDGKISVVNRCIKENGKTITARGIAKTADTATSAKLKVSFVSLFGLRLFWGDYWIIGLDQDYRWAIVGDSGRKYGWILSRTPELPENVRNRINDILAGQGYNPADFVNTVQKYQSKTNNL